MQFFEVINRFLKEMFSEETNALRAILGEKEKEIS